MKVVKRVLLAVRSGGKHLRRMHTVKASNEKHERWCPPKICNKHILVAGLVIVMDS